MFDKLPETHSEFRFLSRRTRDVITGLMIVGALVGEIVLLGIVMWILL